MPAWCNNMVMAHVLIIVIGVAFVGLFILVAFLCQPTIDERGNKANLRSDRLPPSDEDFFTHVDYW
jgi:hypothetical protein